MNKDLDFITIKIKSNPALPNPNCKVLKLIMNQPEKISKWKAALDILERTSFKTRIDARITFHYNIYHNVYMETTIVKIFYH